jgi:hypothetical protein
VWIVTATCSREDWPVRLCHRRMCLVSSFHLAPNSMSPWRPRVRHVRILAAKRRSAVPSVVVARLAAMVKAPNADEEASEEQEEEGALTPGVSSRSAAAAAGEDGTSGPAAASGGPEEGTGSGPWPPEEDPQDWGEGEEEAWGEPEDAAEQSAEAPGALEAEDVLHAWQHIPPGHDCVTGSLCRVASASI